MSSNNRPNLERRIRTWTTVVLFASIVAGLISNAHARDCGGVERWTVKVATVELGCISRPLGCRGYNRSQSEQREEAQ